MPVLLLAQGDPAAKDLLRQAIQARYGLRPPALESLTIQFKGRARGKIGPMTMWVPVEATGRFSFPDSVRWDFAVKAVGVQIGSGVEAFDGETYRTTRNKSHNIDDAAGAESMLRRLWAIAAVLLTPLGEQFVELRSSGEDQLEACNTKINGCVELHLRSDNTLDYVKVPCLNPDSNQQQMFTLRLSDEIRPIDELILPTKISAFWDDEPYFEVEPVAAEANATIETAVFRLSMA